MGKNVVKIINVNNYIYRLINIFYRLIYEINVKKTKTEILAKYSCQFFSISLVHYQQYKQYKKENNYIEFDRK